MATVKNAPAKLEHAEWLAAPDTQAVFEAIEGAGHAVRAVGGTVRNALFGQAVRDIDLATTAPPDEVMRVAEAAGLKAVATGIEHGTVTIVSGGTPIEVTTLRRDIETFGRHARVAFTTDWRADAARRDFTMNALYCDRDGTIFDPLGGYDDLIARRVRFIGSADDRIHEDYLRILRFFRFAAEYGDGPLDENSLAACVRGRGGLAQLSAERVRVELLKLLAAPLALDAIEAMFDHGLLVDVLGSVPALSRLTAWIEFDARHHLGVEPVRRLGALVIRVAEDVERVADRLRLSNKERARLSALAIEKTAPCLPGDQESAKAQLYMLGRDGFLNGLFLATGRDVDDTRFAQIAEFVNLAKTWEAPQLPVAGRDILDLGLGSGPEVGDVLARLEQHWVEERFMPDRARLLALAKELIDQSNADDKEQTARERK